MRLIDLKTDTEHEISASGCVVGRGADCDVFLHDAHCSRQQFSLSQRGGRWAVDPLSNRVPTLVSGKRISGRQELRNGDIVSAGRTRFRVEVDGTDPGAALIPGTATQVGSGLAGSAPVEPANTTSPLNDGERTILGRDPDADVCLPHVQVSRKHATLRRVGDRVIVEDLGSANGTFVDGHRVVLPEILAPGSVIGIGPYSLVIANGCITTTARTNNVQLEARNLVQVVPDRNNVGDSRTILHDVSVVVRPGEFVCMLGPAGSGKSTLLKALSARVPASSGQVLINQSDLYENFDELKRDIVVVPQHDILHDELPLEEALRYTATMRLPADTSQQECDQAVNALLQRVGLYPHRKTKIGQLSGGQRRRASLVNELIANPNLLFLDEVTSGLDEQTDREMMGLFRQLAEEGKTVVCVTHSLANVDESCGLLVLLAEGGRLAFVGTPNEAREFFGVDRLGDVYAQLQGLPNGIEIEQRFAASDLYRRYVLDRLSPGAANPAARQTREWTFEAGLHTFRHQFPVLLRRAAAVALSEKRSIRALIMQVATVALVVFMVFGDIPAAAASNDQSVSDFREASQCCQVLFVLAVSCFWFGCNNSVREIVRERPIYTRELQVNLDPLSYYFSKYALQLSLAMAQSATLLFCVSMLCQLPGGMISQFLLLTMSAACGVALGLFISTVAQTETFALTLVPLVLIPQIILSDIFVELKGLSSWLGGTFITNFWVYGSLRGTLPDALVQQMNSGLAPPRSTGWACVVTAAQLVTLSTAAILILHIRDRVLATSNKTLRTAIEELPIVGPTVAAMAPRRKARRPAEPNVGSAKLSAAA